jgi:ribonuclease HII
VSRLRVAGVDEAGRGPLAGPVYAACVILDPERPIPGLADSKVLSQKRRESLAEQIRTRALAWSIEAAAVEEIDRINILQATMAAMARAVAGLAVIPDEVLVDGNRLPPLRLPARAIVRGDALEPAISAASILAKTARDAHMQELHAMFPEYGFDRHKGYPTAEHLAILSRLGPTPQHRRSFAPVRAVLGPDFDRGAVAQTF